MNAVSGKPPDSGTHSCRTITHGRPKACSVGCTINRPILKPSSCDAWSERYGTWRLTCAGAHQNLHRVVRTRVERRQQAPAVGAGGIRLGFVALADGAELLYKTTEFFIAENDRVLAWDDPDIGVAWPLEGPPTLSDKDRSAPALAEALIFD